MATDAAPVSFPIVIEIPSCPNGEPFGSTMYPFRTHLTFPHTLVTAW
jgi:hypothetical protein